MAQPKVTIPVPNHINPELTGLCLRLTLKDADLDK